MTGFFRRQFVRITLYAARFRLELLLVPFVYLSALLLYAVRTVGVARLTRSRSLFQKTGVFPIADQYYDPLFQPDKLKGDLATERSLPGIDFNDSGQLELLRSFDYNDELLALPREKKSQTEFYFDNPEFGSGDAEYLYNVIRHFKPRRIVEVGAGNSTLLMIAALKQNEREDPACRCRYTAIDPFGPPWLEQTGIDVIRKPVEETDAFVFQQLEANDILFIDSSHVIRPQGDVLFLYLKLLPALAPGVIVHVHDVFTPRDYPYKWVIEDVRLWNEQYLLEAFLSCNKSFAVLGALNYLKHRHPAELAAKCPVLQTEMENREPGSFWMVKRGSRS